MSESASADDAAGLPADAVEVGRILGGWGVKGWLKVQPFSGDPQALTSSREWFLVPGPRVSGAVSGGGRASARSASSASSVSSAPAAGLGQPGLPAQLEIVRAKLQAGTVLATARGVLDRDAADRLAGARVYVPRSQFPAADEGEYYWVDLIGLDVVNREDQMLGQVASLIETGVHDVLKVVDASSEAPVERLIPFVPVYIDRVDLPGRRITVDWGLDY